MATMKAKKVTSNLEATIDEFGNVKAQIAELEIKQSALRNDLKSLGLGTYVGDQYVLTISESKREVLDMDAVKELLSQKFIEAHTTISRFPVLKATKRKNGTREEEAA